MKLFFLAIIRGLLKISPSSMKHRKSWWILMRIFFPMHLAFEFQWLSLFLHLLFAFIACNFLPQRFFSFDILIKSLNPCLCYIKTLLFFLLSPVVHKKVSMLLALHSLFISFCYLLLHIIHPAGNFSYSFKLVLNINVYLRVTTCCWVSRVFLKTAIKFINTF